jgi:large subunit ribosomal protein L3
MKGILGRKLGMTRVFTADGQCVPVTVVEAGPCPVLRVRTKERDGYAGLQLGFGSRKAKNVNKAVRGQVAAAGRQDTPPELIGEIRLDADPGVTVGQLITADIFQAKDVVDVVGVTKGRGFQGVVRRHHFAGGRAAHGGGWNRRPGSIGMKDRPGKIYKGRRMPGHMGNERRTVQNLEVVQVNMEDNLLLIKGAIPGPNGRHVIVKQAIKKKAAQKK